jgi:hypothetical protein
MTTKVHGWIDWSGHFFVLIVLTNIAQLSLGKSLQDIARFPNCQRSCFIVSY